MRTDSILRLQQQADDTDAMIELLTELRTHCLAWIDSKEGTIRCNDAEHGIEQCQDDLEKLGVTIKY